MVRAARRLSNRGASETLRGVITVLASLALVLQGAAADAGTASAPSSLTTLVFDVGLVPVSGTVSVEGARDSGREVWVTFVDAAAGNRVEAPLSAGAAFSVKLPPGRYRIERRAVGPATGPARQTLAVSSSSLVVPPGGLRGVALELGPAKAEFDSSSPAAVPVAVAGRVLLNGAAPRVELPADDRVDSGKSACVRVLFDAAERAPQGARRSPVTRRRSISRARWSLAPTG